MSENLKGLLQVDGSSREGDGPAGPAGIEDRTEIDLGKKWEFLGRLTNPEKATDFILRSLAQEIDTPSKRARAHSGIYADFLGVLSGGMEEPTAEQKKEAEAWVSDLLNISSETSGTFEERLNRLISAMGPEKRETGLLSPSRQYPNSETRAMLSWIDRTLKTRLLTPREERGFAELRGKLQKRRVDFIDQLILHSIRTEIMRRNPNTIAGERIRRGIGGPRRSDPEVGIREFVPNPTFRYGRPMVSPGRLMRRNVGVKPDSEIL
ncbi:MAG: hypothetical protein ABH845_05740 [Candidatus Omnitrophota bacterium]